MRLTSAGAWPRMAGRMAKRLAQRLRSRYGLAIAAAVTLQLIVLGLIRFVATGPDGGDMCRDVVAAHRLFGGRNPYARIPSCGVLFNLPHPPAYLLLIGPFALLPMPAAAIIWSLVTLAALAASLALIARELGIMLPAWRLGLLLGLLVFWPPLLGTLLEAQVSPILLLLLALTWCWARRGRSGWAGAALGLAGAIRLVPLLAVLYFLLRRDWRAVFAAGATFVVASLLPFPLIGTAGYLAYATSEAPQTTASWIGHEHNISIWGFASLLFVGHRSAAALGHAPNLVKPLALALIAAALAVLVARTYARRRLPFREDESTFLAYLPLMLLASPLTWEHYFVILLLPLLVVGQRVGWLGAVAAPGIPSAVLSRERTNLRWLVAIALAVIEVNYLVGLLSLPRVLPGIFGPLVFALPTYALALVFIALLRTDTAAARRSHAPTVAAPRSAARALSRAAAGRRGLPPGRPRPRVRGRAG